MKRFLGLALAVVVAVGLVAGPAAHASEYVGAFDAVSGAPTDLAAAYSNMPIEEGPSNRRIRTTEFTTEVQVAQWSKWEFSGTKWTWFVRKPGEYYADSIKATVQSNGNVAITFSGFDNPQYLDSNPLEGVKKEIESYYGVGSDPRAGDFTGWIAAADLNEEEVILPDSERLHEGMRFKLWNKITVCECNTASTYRNTGVITLTVQNQKPWIDDDGNWNPGQDDLFEYLTTNRGV